MIGVHESVMVHGFPQPHFSWLVPSSRCLAVHRLDKILLNCKNSEIYNKNEKPHLSGHLEYLPIKMVASRVCTSICHPSLSTKEGLWP